MRCGHCGEPLPTGALFCGECGRAVQSAAPSTPRTARVSMVTPVAPPPPPPTAVPIAAPPPTASVTPPAPSAPPVPSAPPAGASPTVIVEPVERTETGDTGGTQDSDVPAQEPVVAPNSVPAASTPAPLAPPAPAGPPRPLVPGPALDVDDDDDGDIDDDPTTVSPRRVPPAVSATVVASTGQRFQVGGRVLLGRRPSPAPGQEYDAVLVLVDDGKTISKTHLELIATEERITVIDLGSGNGTVIETPGEPPVRCVAGVPHPVPRGSRLVLGRQYLVVA